MCIMLNPSVQVSLNKRGLGIGYKILEVARQGKKEVLISPFARFDNHVTNKWETCDEEFRGNDPRENHGFHIYLSFEAARRTAETISHTFYQKIYEVYFKDIHAIGEAVNVASGLPPYPCVVAKKMLIRKKLWESKSKHTWQKVGRYL